jgi:hypothetical protein
LIVGFSNTVINPFAMMVEVIDTTIASPTMLRVITNEQFTNLAVILKIISVERFSNMNYDKINMFTSPS